MYAMDAIPDQVFHGDSHQSHANFSACKYVNILCCFLTGIVSVCWQ